MKKITWVFIMLTESIYAQTVIKPNTTDQFITSAGIVVDDKGTNNGSITNGIKFGTTFSGEGIGSRRVAGTNLYGLDFYSNSINRMTITNAGKIGIGTIEPVSKFEVQNGGIGLFNLADNKRWEFNYDQTNNYFYIDEYGSGKRLTIKNGGMMGLNSTNPQNILHVHQPNIDNNFIQLTNPATGNSTAYDGLRIGIDYLGNSMFWNGNNKNMYFNVNGEFNVTIAETTGFVGIGTETPDSKLDVENGGISISNITDAKRWELAYDQNNNYFYIDEYGSARRFVIENGGHVGIGTTNPSFPLEINASLNTSATVSEYDYNQVSHNPTNSSFSTNYSMKANEAILARKFNAFSDNRHKLLLEYPDSKKVLKTINLLKPATYKYIDSVALGRQINLGFMAQEVEKEYPEAVTKIKTEFIPNIYQMARTVLLEKNTKILTLILEKPHSLTLNDEIKVFGKQEYQVKVSKIINENTFEIKNWEDDSERIFVFGKKVEDFRTVDYDRIFTLGISAIQELSKELNETKKNLLTEKNINLEQEKKLQNLETKLSEILNQIKQ